MYISDCELTKNLSYPPSCMSHVQYIPRNMHTDFALLCFVVVIHWLIFPYPSGLLHWHCGNLTIAPVPAKQPWWIWINTSCEFIMNDCITTTKQSTTKPCAYFLGYTVMSFVSTLKKIFLLYQGSSIWALQSKILMVTSCPSHLTSYYGEEPSESSMTPFIRGTHILWSVLRYHMDF